MDNQEKALEWWWSIPIKQRIQYYADWKQKPGIHKPNPEFVTKVYNLVNHE